MDAEITGTTFFYTGNGGGMTIRGYMMISKNDLPRVDYNSRHAF